MSEWITYSGNGGCVEFQQQIDGSVLVRDTKDRNGPWLQFTEAEWSDFTDGIKAELQRKNTAQGLEMARLEQQNAELKASRLATMMLSGAMLGALGGSFTYTDEMLREADVATYHRFAESDGLSVTVTRDGPR